MAARKKAAKKRARKKAAKKRAKAPAKAAKKQAGKAGIKRGNKSGNKARDESARRPHEGLPPASDRELEQLRGAPEDLPPGRKAEPVTFELTAEQSPDMAVAFAHYRHSFPKATAGDLVAWLLREYRRLEDLLP